jgi:hypothetical protein
VSVGRKLLIVGAAMAGAAAAMRANKRASVPSNPSAAPAPRSGEGRTDRAEGGVHLMMEDGSVVEASGEVDPDGRLRYLADNLLGSPDDRT